MKSDEVPRQKDSLRIRPKKLRWIESDPHSFSFLMRSTGLALLIEITLLTGIGRHEHWLAHPIKKNIKDQFIDAEIYSVPPKAHLVEERKKITSSKPREATLSKIPGQGKTGPKTDPTKTENQTEPGPTLAPSHGPVALYTPHPTIPSYLQNQDLHAYVIIDFYVNTQGHATPRLVGSSGNEELDAIAITTVKKWQFRPAEKDHQPIDSKVRLRIIFEVK